MDFSTWFDGGFQQHIVDIDALDLSRAGRTLVRPLIMVDNGYQPPMIQNSTNVPHSVPTGDSEPMAGSLQVGGPLVEWYGQCDPPSLPKYGPIFNIPVEILIRISQLVAPLHTQDGLHVLSKLTHVCRFWRMALMNHPRLWSTIFLTPGNRRSFVEACLERSLPVMLNVFIGATKWGTIHSDCTCDKGTRAILLPNESKPCEWHFQYELLADTIHSNRIRALDIYIESDRAPANEQVRLALAGCRFFTFTFPRLATLKWRNCGTSHADYLFATSPFVPTLCSLTYVGCWNGSITQVKNLTSLFFTFDPGLRSSKVDTEAFRLLMCNNRSLESLTLNFLDLLLVGDSKGPPVYLSNLRSLTLDHPSKTFSTTIRIPAFQRLTFLRISSNSDESDEFVVYTLYSTGDEITMTIVCFLDSLAETWEDLTGYWKPVISHVRLSDESEPVDHYSEDNSTLVLLMKNAQTLEVGFNYLVGWYGSFWEDLKQLGSQLKTIRFEVLGDMEPCLEMDEIHDDLDGDMWDNIADLVKYRFDQGRPFSVVERLVVSENERENRLQAYVWRCFYGIRKIGQYVRPMDV